VPADARAEVPSGLHPAVREQLPEPVLQRGNGLRQLWLEAAVPRLLRHRGVDELLEAADICEHEQVHVVDVDNGARFETYTIAGERGSGEMKVNGAAARLVHRGDTIIVISYGQYDREELETYYEPRVVHVEAQTNHIIDVDAEVATLLS